jgi:DNA polymerase (family 10)
MSRRSLSNADVAQALREMALFLEMDAVPYKPQAYERAAETVLALAQPIADIHARGGERALMLLPGIGKGIAGRIAGLLTTGEMVDLEHLRQRTPVDVLELTAVDGISPQAVRELWQELGVRDVDDLERAARLGRIAPLFHFGEEGELKLLEAIAQREEATGRRAAAPVIDRGPAPLSRGSQW